MQYGSQAYDDAVKDFETGKQRARDEFGLSSYTTGMNTALTQRNQPLNEGAALMSGGQITQPSWMATPQAAVQGTDIAGITNQNYQNQLSRSAQQGQAWNALSSLGGMALGGWLSDERIKNISSTKGVDPESGLPVRKWSYMGQKQKHLSPTAQDVEAGGYADAVSEGPDGLKRVDWKSYPQLQKFMPKDGEQHNFLMDDKDLRDMIAPKWPGKIIEQMAAFSPRELPDLPKTKERKPLKKKEDPYRRPTPFLAGGLSKLGSRSVG
jgi:hypothetical protein